MSDHKSEEKEMQAFIDEWLADNDKANVKMFKKTLRIERQSTVYQTFFFDLLLPEDDLDNDYLSYDTVQALLKEGIDFGTPDNESYSNTDDEPTIMDRTKRT